MSKYQPLTGFLRGRSMDRVTMTFAEIEKVLGFKLPSSAYEYPAWWANDTGKSHVQARAWISAGYETEQVDQTARKLVFKRTTREYGVLPVSKQQNGMAEPQTTFKHAPSKIPRSPLWGAMKGTFTLVPPSEPVTPKDPDDWEGLSLAKLDKLLFGIGE